MLKEIRFQNFRCFKDLKIEGLQRFNIFGGKNNVGKTAALEGVYLNSQPLHPEIAAKIYKDRGIETYSDYKYEIWTSLINMNNNQELIIEQKDINGEVKSLEIGLIKFDMSDANDIKRFQQYLIKLGAPEHLPPGVLYKVNFGDYIKINAVKIIKGQLFYDLEYVELRNYKSEFLSAKSGKNPSYLAQLYSNSTLKNREKDILDNIRILDKTIRRLEVIAREDSSLIYCSRSTKDLLPLQFIGEGSARFLSMLLMVENYKDGIILIDEIENGIHYSALEKIIDCIYTLAAKYNVQIFATTHSRELVEAAHRVFSKKEGYPFRYYRLDEVNGDIAAKGYSRDALDSALENEREIR